MKDSSLKLCRFFENRQKLKGMILNMEKITLKELAEQLNVSISAVSLALNGRPGVSEETRERIVREAERAGYRCRTKRAASAAGSEKLTGAQGKNTGKKTLNILILYYQMQDAGEANDSIFLNSLRGISTAAEAENCSVSVRYLTHGRPFQAESYTAYDGILLFAATVQLSEELSELLSLPLPIVLFDNEMPQCSVSSVSIDNAGGVFLGFDWMRRHGYRRIAFLTLEGHTLNNTVERLNAYTVCCRQAGVQPLVAALSREQTSESFISWYVSQPEKPDGFLAFTDYLAMQLQPAFQELSLNLGADCGIIGFDNLPIGTMFAPALSSIDIHNAERGGEALRLLLSHIRGGKETPVRHVRIGTKLILRESSPNLTRKKEIS